MGALAGLLVADDEAGVTEHTFELSVACHGPVHPLAGKTCSRQLKIAGYERGLPPPAAVPGLAAAGIWIARIR